MDILKIGFSVYFGVVVFCFKSHHASAVS